MASSRRFVDQQKLDYLCNNLQSEGIDIAVFQDFEYRRDENVRYLTGHPMDAHLFLDTSNGDTVLIPWDYKLARKMAEVNEIVDLKDHDNSYIGAIAHVLKNRFGKKDNYSIGTISRYPAHSTQILKEMGEKISVNFSPLCLEKYMKEIRAVKTSKEIKSLKMSCKLNSSIIPLIESFINENDPTEVDLAVHVEGQMRKLGGEKVAFETLVTNPEHSNEIHCFPLAGKRKLKVKPGLGLIDFGMKYEAMCSDITTPFIFGKIDPFHIRQDFSRATEDGRCSG
ncbi:MAG: M24 family metallopeptidase [Candidatus Hodarchaeales archaeon]